jgi:hypothetical protein
MRIGIAIHPLAFRVLFSSVVAIVGCGDDSVPKPSPSPAGIITCFDDYPPNYSADILESTDEKVVGTFYQWDAFPLNVYFHQGSVWTQSREDHCGSGFDGWSVATEGRVSWVKVDDESQAQVTVQFLAPGELNGAALGSTALAVYAETQRMVNAYMRIANTSNLQSLEQTCAHEFGHALGIGGHSPLSMDLMFYKQNMTTPTSPTERDVNTLLGAYCASF